MTKLKVINGRNIISMERKSTIWSKLYEIIKREEKKISPNSNYAVKMLINKKGYIFQIIYIAKV